eukprot:288483-Prorocentrum_minimum.AAC.2
MQGRIEMRRKTRECIVRETVALRGSGDAACMRFRVRRSKRVKPSHVGSLADPLSSASDAAIAAACSAAGIRILRLRTLIGPP